MNLTGFARRYLPFLDWGASYTSKTLANDLTAALIVTIMLIPQSLAYALLVGLPAQVGFYASMAPLLLYELFGTSRALAVGPVAVASLMTAAAAGQIASQGTPEYLAATIVLALVTGLILPAMGVLRLGFLANFLSHPVISGFITASAIQIAAGQVAPLLGIRSKGENLLDILKSMLPNLGNILPLDATIGPARVIRIEHPQAILPAELEAHDLQAGERVLFLTRNSGRCWKSDQFVEDFVYISAAAAQFLVERKVRTIGVDYLSVGGYVHDGVETHRILLGAGIWLIEGLNLSAVQPGAYELVCLPLRVVGADGAPARAILRPAGSF